MERSITTLNAVALLAVLTGAAASFSAGQTVTPQDPRTYTYREVDGRELGVHVFVPAGHKATDPANAVLLFHGGGWHAGDAEWTFTAARRFAEWGLVAISVQYRLSVGDITPIEALDDVCAAFRWTHQQAEELGITGRVAGYGVSAGGHLVAATATIGCGEGDAQYLPDALLLWSPALDVGRDGWFERMLQGRADPADYAPADHVQASTPPTSIVVGELDNLTPLSGDRRYCDQLIELGGTCEINVYPGVGHLLTRNLANQESDFDPDPQFVADGIAEHREFLIELGFISNR